MNYKVRDIKLAAQGLKNIELAEMNMGALMEVRKEMTKSQIFKGLRIAMALHVTKETAVLVRTFRSAGAEVFITGCNPLSTQDDIAAALAKEGVHVYAHKGESGKEYYEFLNYVIAGKPHITIDDGCDLVSEIHKKHAHLIPEIIGGCEETTTGIIRLQAMERDKALKYPVVAVNDNLTKHLMDNYYGTGQSTLDGIVRATNCMFAGKTAVVAGYGSCGKGVALRLRGMGSNVIVTEVTPFRALQAVMDGFRVMKMKDAAKIGDLFVTVTGDIDVLTADHVKDMKEGAILANSGHFDCEIDVEGIRKKAKSVRTIRPFMDEFVMANGKRVYILGEGRLINLAAAEGHPSEVMSLSFCGQAKACEYLVKNKGKLAPTVHTLPEEIDTYISGLQLKAMGIEIDKLTPAQQKYLSSWESGT
ncbi:MAG: adenosylhomocysteinase [Candidatus Gracilibacteria bacterium]|nr:adenosylhomocysteinase [Candidatus Gracilibacteria bacterium]